MYTALTIAGSDSSGGAGIQADIKTMSANGVYAMSAVTALTAQNTTGVTDILNATPEFLGEQLDAVFTDIFPDAVKIGMLSNEEIMRVVAAKLIQHKARHVVLDPVMVATSGSVLMEKNAKDFLMQGLLPLAEIITPNIPETEELTGMEIRNKDDMIEAAGLLYHKIKYIKEEFTKNGERENAFAISQGKQPDDVGRNISLEEHSDYAIQKIFLEMKEAASAFPADTAVLVKGGHSINDADDILFLAGSVIVLEGERIDNPNTHGTGCTLSSAIASNLAKGFSVEQSVKNAKEYLTGALRSGLDLGKGRGPVNHLWQQDS